MNWKALLLLIVAGETFACASKPRTESTKAASTAEAPVARGAPPEQAAAPAKPAPKIGSFGFDPSGMDRSVTPGTSFFEYANGSWVKTAEIPADRASYGMFTALDDLSNERTKAIIEESAKTQAAAGSEAQKVGDFYASFMDEASIEAAGLSPVQDDLKKIAAIKDKAELARAFAREGRDTVNIPFGVYVNNDDKNPTQYVPIYVQAGLGMPDRDYYLSKDEKLVAAREKYQQHIGKILKLGGIADPEKKAKAIYELERKMAEVHWTRVDSRDADKTYNKWMRPDFDKKAPGFDWKAYFAEAGLGTQTEFVVQQPSAFTGMSKLIRTEALGTWKDYLTYRVLSDSAPVLSKAFVEEDFDFRERVLNGTPQIKERWKRGVELVNGLMGEAVGKIYVSKYFPPESKKAADELVHNLILSMGDRLDQLSWMSPETKAKAKAKLAAFTPKIGYPDKWRDYSTLTIVRGEAFLNAQRAVRFEYQRGLDKLGKPIDRGEWFMPPMQVNAYANPVMNEIVFPAAILQPPFFDANADPAINYGGIGAVIGHEISHHFDDQGRKYDLQGKLTDWWTPEDVKRFEALAAQLVAQYEKYEPMPGVHINGKLTLGENIADLAGLTVSYDAYKRSLGGKEAPVIDGLTGAQRFFLGWAQVWRTKYRDENLRNRLVTDPHSPAKYRVSVVRNLDSWYTAFEPKAGEDLYTPTEQRVRIW